MESIENISLAKIIPAQNNLFGKYDDDKLQELAESIISNGILEPLIVCPVGFKGDMEIISGNNRYYAAQIAKLSTVPCIIVNPTSDDDKELIAIESNRHRSLNDLPLSKRVIIVARWYNSMIRKGKFSADKNSENEPSNELGTDVSGGCGHSGHDDGILDLSERSARRYASIARLPEYHLERLDTKEIGIRAAQEIVSLRPDTLSLLDVVMGTNELVLTHQIAVALRAADEKGKLLRPDDILDIFTNSKKKVEKKPSYSIKQATLKKYFTKDNLADIESEVDKALTLRRITIPELLDEHNYKTDDIDELIINALKSYLK